MDNTPSASFLFFPNTTLFLMETAADAQQSAAPCRAEFF